MSIDWSKEPKEIIGALVTKPDNVHHPKTVFATEFFKWGCMFRGVSYDGSPFSAVDDCWEWVQRPVDPWTGEGEPPVGTVCEFNGSIAACPYEPWHPDLRDGDEVTIIAYFNDSVGRIAAFTFKARNEDIAAIQVEQARPVAFRPIRTPEQIATEKKITEIGTMAALILQEANSVDVVMTHSQALSIANTLHIDEYRKVTP